MFNYVNLLGQCEKLDRRLTKYQFDIDADVRWDRITEPGLYLTPVLLGDFGVDLHVFATRPEAFEVLQWAAALAMCRVFVDLEEDILMVVGQQPQEFEGCRSIDLLATEERKHVALFNRYATYLEAQRPELVPSFEARYQNARRVHSIGNTHEVSHRSGPNAPSIPTLRLPTTPAEHYMFWLGVLLFEEVTVHVHDRLVAGGDAVQPAWLSAHAAHRREEVQHIATDVRVIDSINVNDDERRHLSIVQVFRLAQTFRAFVGIDTACHVVRERFPDLPAFEREESFMQSGFCQAIRTARAFHHTRALPGFSFLHRSSG